KVYLSSTSSTVIYDDDAIPAIKALKKANRIRKGWNFPSCGSDTCKKALTRQDGQFFCQSCNKIVDYPLLRYRLEVDVSNNTTQAVVVMSNETGTALVNCSIDSLMHTVDESSEDHLNLPPALLNLIGIAHVMEIKSHTYYEMDVEDSKTEDSSDSANAKGKKGVVEPSAKKRKNRYIHSLGCTFTYVQLHGAATWVWGHSTWGGREKGVDALDELQCLYLHKVKECDCLAQKLSKQTESVSKKVHAELLQRFSKVEKHLISLELALQTCKEQNIAISELKKLIEKGKGKSMDTKFDRPFVVRQPNAQRIPKPSVLAKKAVSNTNVLKPGMYRIDNRPHQKSNQSKDKVLPNNSQVKAKKTQVEVHLRIPSDSNKMKSVTACKDSLNSRTLNANAEVACAHHEDHMMRDNVQLDHVVDSHADYMSDSNIILYDQYIKENEVPVVHSDVSSVSTDAFMMIYDDMCEPHDQSVSYPSRNTAVQNSLTAELA
nr:hypothetical protein [Tanacetum cinerariifolium]